MRGKQFRTTDLEDSVTTQDLGRKGMVLGRNWEPLYCGCRNNRCLVLKRYVPPMPKDLLWVENILKVMTLPFAQNPGNQGFLIPVAAQSLSCVTFVSFSLILDLVSHPWICLVSFFPEACQVPLEATEAEPKRGNDITFSHSPSPCMSLPLGCLLLINLITCLTARLWAVCALYPGLMWYSVPFCTMQ